MSQPPQRNHLLRLLPPGVRDIFGDEAARLTILHRRAEETFWRWGYAPVVLPTFEYYDVLARGFDEQTSGKMHRFIDAQGNLLALRPDLTIPAARLVASRLTHEAPPVRLAYVAPLFRYVEPRAGQQREFREIWQAGVECVGVNNADADAEIIALHVETLRAMGLPRFQLNLGHMGFVHGVFEALETSPPNVAAIRRAIDRKNRHVLAEELDRAGVHGPARAALEALPTLWGQADVLSRAATLAPTPRARSAIERLQHLVERLEAYGVRDSVTIDLGEVRGMHYYTGITFETFAPHSGYPIAGGGRYDNLLALYGYDAPAVGFAIFTQRVLDVLDAEGAPPATPRPEALMVACGHAACLADLQRRRAAGAHIELDLSSRSPEATRRKAAARGIRAVLVCGEWQEVTHGD
nr:ATP phosphoribosyltransferase regulatory subunit [Ardenticatena sp.]